MSKKGVVAGLFLVLAAVPAFASAPVFEKIDSDKDGVISGNEAATAGISKELFTQFDLDKNSMLNAVEYKALVDNAEHK